MNGYPLKDWLNPKAEIRETPGKGKGMFAAYNIKKDEKVLIWGGEYVGFEAAGIAKESGKHVMQWDENVFSIEDRGDDIGYYINHSCEPNTWMADERTFVAMRDISQGEEITTDYSLWEARGDDYVSKWECSCGSKLCRKKLTGKDWKNSNLQERYKGHFSPLINKRISNL